MPVVDADELCVAPATSGAAVVGVLVLAGAYGFYLHAKDYATRWPMRFDAPV